MSESPLNTDERPFFKHWHPCGYCGENIEVQEIFFHQSVTHDNEYLDYGHFDPTTCNICGEEVPEGTDWKATFRHFEEEHGITVIEYGGGE